MIIDSLLVQLGFNVDENGIGQFEKKVQVAANQVMGLVKVAGIAAAAVGAFVYSVASSMDDLGDFADRNDVGVESLQELGYAAQLNGSSLDAVKASVQGVNSVIGQAITGVGRGAKMFEKFGLSARNADGSVKNFDQILDDVAKRMQGMDRREALSMAEKLGIDASLVPMLQSGAANIATLREEARAFGVTSEDDAKAAGAFADAMDRTKFMIQALTNSLAVGLMPMVTDVIDRFKAWYLENHKVIKSGLETFLKYTTVLIGLLWNSATRLVSALINAVQYLSQFKVITYAAGMAVAWLMVSLFAIPIAIGAIIAAVLLLLDDYTAWQEGNDSLIGDILNKWPNAIHIMRSLLIGLGVVFTALGVKSAIAMGRIAVSTIISAATQVAAWLSVAAATIAATWPILLVIVVIAAVGVAIWALWDNWAAVTGYIGTAWEDLKATIMTTIGGAIDYVIEVFNSAKATVMGFIDSAVNAINTVKELLGLGGGSADVNVSAAGGGAEPMSLPEAVSQSPALGEGGGLAQQSQAAASGSGVSSTPTAARTGVLGRAESMPAPQASSNVTTNTNTTNVAKIEVVSSDPSKAGEAVADKLNSLNKKNTRNGQSSEVL